VRIVVLDDYQRVAAEMADWSLAGPDIKLTSLDRHIDDETELAAALAGVPVVVAMRERTRFTPSLFDALPDLKLLVTTGPFNAVIDMEAAAAHGVTLCGTGGMITPTSELTWALILALLRHIPADDADMRAGRWQRNVGIGLQGRRLGLLGLGRLGSLVAKVGRAFDMDVVAWSTNLTPEKCAEAGIGYVYRDELFATSDVLSIHLVLGPRSRGLVGRAELAAMKPTAILVNTSRGPIVDEAALIDALRNGTIAGAGLDVFDQEPLPPDHPLRTLPNTVLTPHVGYVTRQTYEIFYRDIVDDIRAWRDGAPIRLVTPAP
jgi:phosphoglycerate dehydrogenase-like enzyme